MDADLIEGQHSAAYFKLDDAGRRKLGVPRIDQHVYSRENGWAIDALAVLYAATGDRQSLDQARARRSGLSRIARCMAADSGTIRKTSPDLIWPTR